MSSQTSGGEASPSSPSNQRTFLDEVILTFTSPMAWLLVVALILTWSGVAIVLFDLLDYKTLAGLPPPSAIGKRGLRARGKMKHIHICVLVPNSNYVTLQSNIIPEFPHRRAVQNIPVVFNSTSQSQTSRYEKQNMSLSFIMSPVIAVYSHIH
uniref:Triadin n=1 Tax=Fundulus heteroclitus TaxID=8078 RepID=A0A3Q2QYM4_FUNHE